MWVAEHEPGCSDQSRYSVLTTYLSDQDAEGNVLDADKGGEVDGAECAECGAKAHWQE